MNTLAYFFTLEDKYDLEFVDDAENTVEEMVLQGRNGIC